MKRALLLAVLPCLWLPQFAEAQSFTDGDVLYVMPVHPSPDPWVFSDGVETCLNDTPTCQSAVQALGDHLGLSPDTALDLAKTANTLGWATTFRRADEQYWQRFEQPEGYILCNLFVSTLSTAPTEGEFAPYLSIRADQTRVSVYNFVHAAKQEDPPAYYDGVVSIHLTPEASSDTSQCSLQTGSDKQAKYACQGSVNFDGEYPVCSSDPHQVTPD